MTWIEAIVLGIVQGVAEFFPVSSSGHLVLASQLFGYAPPDDALAFSVVLHVATLLVVLLAFRERIRHVLTSERSELWRLVLATLPLFPMVFLIKPIKAYMEHPLFLGLAFMVTGIVVLCGEAAGEKTVSRQKRARDRWLAPLVVGIGQAFAVLPGISRLGMTTSLGRWFGWSRRDAVIFSLLLSIFAVLGALTLEIYKIVGSSSRQASLPIEPGIYVVGFFTAFLVGRLSLKALLALVDRGSFRPFGWYCLALGIGTITTMQLLG